MLHFRKQVIPVILPVNNILKNIFGQISDFNFKIKSTWNTQFTIYYLAVNYKDELLIKQFENGEWKYNLFIEVINNLKGHGD